MLQDLQEFIDNYLKTSGFTMTSKQFYNWKKGNDKNDMDKQKGKQNGDGKTYRRKLLEKEQRKHLSQYLRTQKSYEDAIRWAQEDWKLSTDGIVTALWYNATDDRFIAQINYTKME